MSHIEKGLRFDSADDPMHAIEEYEHALNSEDCALEIYLNLFSVYFICTDPGYFAHHNLSTSFIDLAWKRGLLALQRAESKFAQNSEIMFWKLYAPYVRLGEPEFVEACLKLVNPAESLIPYFYLFFQFKGTKYRSEATELYSMVKDRSTARKRWVEGALRSPLQPNYEWHK